MPPIFTRAPTPLRIRGIILAASLAGTAACASDRPGPVGPEGVPSSPQTPGQDQPLASVAWAGGIPFGTFEQPTNKFGTLFNGAKLTLRPLHALDSLKAVKARGGRVVLKLAGNDTSFQTSTGRFDFAQWKAQVDRFRKVAIGPYITDGTIYGHYMIDEPGSTQNWGGVVIPQSTLEAMAKYSKSIWPNLPTLVRVESTYLAKWTGTYVYLDAAWAQYVYRKGPVGDFITRNIADAKKKGLALAVGLNLLNGGPNRSSMNENQVSTWGSALLNSTYPCSFISWEYNSAYLSNTAIRTALANLRSKAQNRAWKSCKGT
jgi:hypothetical protein